MIGTLSQFHSAVAVVDGDVTTGFGHFSSLTVGAGDTVTTFTAFHAESTAGSGAVTTAYGLHVEDQGSSSTTTYGVQIEDQTGTAAYGVWQDGTDDLNVFRGAVIVGATALSGSEALRVVGDVDITGKLTVSGVIDPTDLVFTEQSDHTTTPVAGIGILWVRDDAPNVIVFTDDTGVDTVLGAGGGGVSQWTENAIIHVAKEGNDGNNGRSINAPKLTLGVQPQGLQCCFQTTRCMRVVDVGGRTGRTRDPLHAAGRCRNFRQRPAGLRQRDLPAQQQRQHAGSINDVEVADQRQLQLCVAP